MRSGINSWRLARLTNLRHMFGPMWPSFRMLTVQTWICDFLVVSAVASGGRDTRAPTVSDAMSNTTSNLGSALFKTSPDLFDLLPTRMYSTPGARFCNYNTHSSTLEAGLCTKT